MNNFAARLIATAPAEAVQMCFADDYNHVNAVEVLAAHVGVEDAVRLIRTHHITDDMAGDLRRLATEVASTGYYRALTDALLEAARQETPAVRVTLSTNYEGYLVATYSDPTDEHLTTRKFLYYSPCEALTSLESELARAVHSDQHDRDECYWACTGEDDDA